MQRSFDRRAGHGAARGRGPGGAGSAAVGLLLCVVYGAIALLALVATWHQNVAYFGGDPFTGTVRFRKATLLTPASRMPLTFEMLTRPSRGLWIAIRLVLAVVGLGSVGLLAALLFIEPRKPVVAHALAVLGLIAFCLQTAMLDALVWPAYFP